MRLTRAPGLLICFLCLLAFLPKGQGTPSKKTKIPFEPLSPIDPKNTELTRKVKIYTRYGLNFLEESTFYPFLKSQNRSIVAFLQDAELYDEAHLTRLVAELEMEEVNATVGLVDCKAHPEMAQSHFVYHFPDIRLYNKTNEVLNRDEYFPMSFARGVQWMNVVFQYLDDYRFVEEPRRTQLFSTFKDITMKNERVHIACLCFSNHSELWQEAQFYKETLHVPFEVFFLNPYDIHFQSLYGYEDNSEKLLFYSALHDPMANRIDDPMSEGRPPVLSEYLEKNLMIPYMDYAYLKESPRERKQFEHFRKRFIAFVVRLPRDEKLTVEAQKASELLRDLGVSIIRISSSHQFVRRLGGSKREPSVHFVEEPQSDIYARIYKMLKPITAENIVEFYKECIEGVYDGKQIRNVTEPWVSAKRKAEMDSLLSQEEMTLDSLNLEYDQNLVITLTQENFKDLVFESGREWFVLVLRGCELECKIGLKQLERIAMKLSRNEHLGFGWVDLDQVYLKNYNIFGGRKPGLIYFPAFSEVGYIEFSNSKREVNETAIVEFYQSVTEYQFEEPLEETIKSDL